MRRTNVPPWPRASSQLNSAVRALPTCRWPVGLGAKRTRMASSTARPATSTATACAAIASPRPTASTPSLVLPLTLTAVDATPSTPPAAARIAVDMRRELRPLEHDRDVGARRPTSRARATMATARASRSRPGASFQRRIGVRESAGRCRPRRRRRTSHRPARDTARRRRNGRAGPRSNGIDDAGEHERPAFDQPMQVVAGADARRRSRRAPRAAARSSGVVIFTFARLPSTTPPDVPPARRASPRRSRRRRPRRARRRRRSTSRRNPCGVCASQTRREGSSP